MPKISLSHNESLEISGEGLRVRRSLKAGTSLEQREDGLYAKQEPASGSGGYPDKYRSSQRYIRSADRLYTDPAGSGSWSAFPDHGPG